MIYTLICLGTDVITKGDKTYYLIDCYLPDHKAYTRVFVDKDTYEYCDELPSYEDITAISRLVYDRKINAFKLSINVDKI